MPWLGQPLVVLGVIYLLGGLAAVGCGSLPELGLRSRLGGLASVAAALVALVSGLSLVGAVRLEKPEPAGAARIRSAATGPKVPVATLWLDHREALVGRGSAAQTLELPVAPRSVCGRMFVPAGFLTQIPGYEVEGDAAAGPVTVRSGSRTVTFRAGSDRTPDCQAEGRPEAVPFVERGQLLVPLRYLAEELGDEVSWSAAERRVTILR